MKILVDYTQIPVQRVGVGNYAYNLVKELYDIDKENTYYIVVQDDDGSLDVFQCDRIRLIRVKHGLFRKLVFRLLLEQVYFPYLVLKHRIDLVHSLHYSFPLVTFGAQRLITVHDMTYFTVPDLLVNTKRLYLKFFINLSTRVRSRLICVSEYTKDDLVRITGVDPRKCTVITLGRSEIFRPGISAGEIESTKKKYGITAPYFLFIGTIEPRKNIKKLITVFQEFSKVHDHYQLVIVGKKGWHYEDVFELVSAQRLSGKVIFTGYVEEEEKPVLLNGCEVFVYPSVYEGFGIPILEAISCGAPVITSNISSMPEVAGDAAILIDPTNEEELLQAMLRLTADPAMKQELKEKGFLQAQQYTWRNTAEKTLQSYREYKSY